ncbi:hypothetical protein HDU77_009849 [Chytriomyces hyalinus]|nr:hypothetical protein HDU77_009849 [Chytriomyces hyalinus]
MANTTTTSIRIDSLYQGFEQTELFIIGAFVGAPLELCLGALLLKWTRPKKPGQSKWQLAPILLDLVNIFGAAYQISNLIALFLDRTTCVPFYIFNNIASQLFFICSDMFFLYITYLMSDFSSWVLNFSIALTVNRIGWGLADVVYSGGLYVLEDAACIYVQNITTGTAYPLSDMLVDLFSTGVMIYVIARCVNYDILFDEQLGKRLNQKSKALVAVDKARLTLNEARRAGRQTLNVIFTSPRHPSQ